MTIWQGLNSPKSFTPSWETIPHSNFETAHWFIFSNARLMVIKGDDHASIPVLTQDEANAFSLNHTQFLGHINESPAFMAELDGAPTNIPNYTFLGLRNLLSTMSEAEIGVAGRAVQLMDWVKSNQFCGACGSDMVRKQDEPALACTSCKNSAYPRLNPAIIVAIERDGKLLLARSPRYPVGRFSILAGFVEPGESLEDCVRREVREEVGIEVKDITYFGSQPWPFPLSLMIGFSAKYAGGELVVDGVEIAEADWFGPDELPSIPPKYSISRALIDEYLGQHGDGSNLIKEW